MEATTTVGVHILGHVGEQREQAEGARHMESARDIEPVDQFGQLGVGHTGPTSVYRNAPDSFDERIHRLARLLPNDIAHQTADKTNIGVKLRVLALGSCVLGVSGDGPVNGVDCGRGGCCG